MATVGEEPLSVGKSQTDHLLELASAMLLALATVASAWCVYQSERWGGAQAFRLNNSDAAGRQATELSIKANHDRILDTVSFMRFMTALEQNNNSLQQFYLKRFRPEMRSAINAWLATQPMANPDAPVSPFVMPEYQVSRDNLAQEARQIAAKEHEAAVAAKRQSERYTLVTVLLAAVLFFGGIATHFEWTRIKILVFSLGILVFLMTLRQIFSYPVAP